MPVTGRSTRVALEEEHGDPKQCPSHVQRIRPVALAGPSFRPAGSQPPPPPLLPSPAKSDLFELGTRVGVAGPAGDRSREPHGGAWRPQGRFREFVVQS